jgi:hypothetical protein
MNSQGIIVSVISFNSDADLRWITKTDTYKALRRQWLFFRHRIKKRVVPMMPSSKGQDREAGKEKLDERLGGSSKAAKFIVDIVQSNASNASHVKNVKSRLNDSKEMERQEADKHHEKAFDMLNINSARSNHDRLVKSSFGISYLFRFHSSQSSQSDYVMALSRRWWDIPMFSVRLPETDRNRDGNVGKSVRQSGRNSIRNKRDDRSRRHFLPPDGQKSDEDYIHIEGNGNSYRKNDGKIMNEFEAEIFQGSIRQQPVKMAPIEE